jgi:large subunit ribosomal protein L17
MLKNMVSSVIEHEAIKTTVPKAKEARKLVEKMITLGKKGGLANVRLASKTVKNKDLLHKLFNELNQRYATRPGGYTRIIRLDHRTGDAADMALLELVDRKPRAKAAEGEGETAEKSE